MSPVTATLVGIVLGTFVSEDLTLIGAGVLVREGRLDAVLAILAAAAGIFLGDVGLWLAGRAGAPVLGRIREHQVAAILTRWLDTSPGLAIVVSRFLPGARLPMYVAAGAWGRRPRAVVAWMLASAAIWTPLVILAVVAAGDTAARRSPSAWAPATGRVGIGVLALAALATSRLPLLRDPALLDRWLQQWRRWEFWPAWLVNLPVAAWVCLLACRYRSATLFTAANPGIEDGGFVGESKSAILESLPACWVLPSIVVPAGALEERRRTLRRLLAQHAWQWPLVAKPDVGQRGVAVRWIQSDAQADAYLSAVGGAVLFQVPHEGPYEAGLYYRRAPGEMRGHVTSITDKRFPAVVGDGRSTLAMLIEAHPRYRLQAALFARRHADSLTTVPPAGAIVPLGRVGNHAQGTEFRDGRALWTPALEARIDAIARSIPGFHLGRFDVRYADRDAFMSGHELAIVELNGVTAEPTHIYDPDASLLQAWRALCAHWTDAFRFGACNRDLGHRPAPIGRLARLLLAHLRAPVPALISD